MVVRINVGMTMAMRMAVVMVKPHEGKHVNVGTVRIERRGSMLPFMDGLIVGMGKAKPRHGKLKHDQK